MPIHARENLYPGVNAHLHSLFQADANLWRDFHSTHITQLKMAIAALLPEGYYAFSEQSLQLLESPPAAPSRTLADVAVYSSQPKPGGGAQAADSAQVLTLPVIATLSDEDHASALVIVRQEGADRIPVTRIELLSPSNKPPGSHAGQYRAKRDETLIGGIRLVEIDYLHERRSPVSALPSYPDGEVGAFPYTILVSDPRPDLQSGLTRVYGVAVGDPIPTIRVPLAGEDAITLDLGAVYAETYRGNAYYGSVAVDYAQPPHNIARYSAQDRTTITRLMDAIAAQHGA